LSEMTDRTGIEWCDPGKPGVNPPTPSTRNIGEFELTLPRAVRRKVEVARKSDDYCGLMEVLSVLYDGAVEASVTGIDMRPDYLEHLATCYWGAAVYRVITVVYDWLTGITEADAVMREWLAIVDEIVSQSRTVSVVSTDTAAQFCLDPPLVLRSPVVPHGPPHSRGSKSCGRHTIARGDHRMSTAGHSC